MEAATEGLYFRLGAFIFAATSRPLPDRQRATGRDGMMLALQFGVYMVLTACIPLRTVDAIFAPRKNLIIDTDLFSDVDDAGALLLAATSPFVNLLALNVNYPSSYSALAASAILDHYGHGTTPVGIRRPLTNYTFFDGHFYELGEFASKIAYHWSGGSLPWGRAEDAWDPVALYRKVLSGADDASVTIVSVGFLDNLSGLLNSTADKYSPQSGRELIADKVSELVVMGGEYPSGREYNFFGGNRSLAAHVVRSWNSPMVFLGLEVGLQVLTGESLMVDGPADDPVRAAYIYYTYRKPRYSWDPLTVLYAIDGLGQLFEYGNECGFNSVLSDGSNKWIEDETVTNQHWLKLKADNRSAAEYIDRLLLQGAWSVGTPLPTERQRAPADSTIASAAHGEL